MIGSSVLLLTDSVLPLSVVVVSLHSHVFRMICFLYIVFLVPLIRFVFVSFPGTRVDRYIESERKHILPTLPGDDLTTCMVRTHSRCPLPPRSARIPVLPPSLSCVPRSCHRSYVYHPAICRVVIIASAAACLARGGGEEDGGRWKEGCVNLYCRGMVSLM